MPPGVVEFPGLFFAKEGAVRGDRWWIEGIRARAAHRGGFSRTGAAGGLPRAQARIKAAPSARGREYRGRAKSSTLGAGPGRACQASKQSLQQRG